MTARHMRRRLAPRSPSSRQASRPVSGGLARSQPQQGAVVMKGRAPVSTEVLKVKLPDRPKRTWRTACT